MMTIFDIEVVVRIRTTDGGSRPLHGAMNGAGAVRAVVGALNVDFTVSPPPRSGENVWALLARIASEGAHAQAEKYD